MEKNRIKLFADHEVNTGRQPFLDIAKSLSIVFMVAVHALLDFAHPEDAEGVIGAWGSDFLRMLLDDILGGTLAAPVFMFAMGVGIMYSRSSDPASQVRRGKDILWKAVLLNILRAIPYGLMLLLVTQTAEARGETFEKFVEEALQVDVLTFAALTFLLLAFLKRIGLACRGILAVAVGMSVLATFFRLLDFGNGFVNLAVSPFFGVSGSPAHSCFPLFAWFIYPAAGLAFGALLRRCVSTERLFAVVTPVALVLFVSLTTWLELIEWPWVESEEAFYHMTLVEVLYSFTGIFSILGISVLLSHVLGGRIMSVIGETSRMINEVFIVHWLFISCLAAIFCHALGYRVGVYESQLAVPPILVLSFLLARRWCKARAARR